LLLIPLVPLLMKRLDARLLIVSGLLVFATSFLLNTRMSHDYAGSQLVSANIVRALGQAVILAPLGAMATAGIERQFAGAASGLFNMMRNLGGAFGTAILQTFLTKREQFHSNVLTQSVSLFDEATRVRLYQLVQYFLQHGVTDTATATNKALLAIGSRIHLQAYTMAFADTFFMLGAAMVLALAATLLLKKAAHVSAGGAH
jgi:DHA2 family multidrug resistance protein